MSNFREEIAKPCIDFSASDDPPLAERGMHQNGLAEGLKIPTKGCRFLPARTEWYVRAGWFVSFRQAKEMNRNRIKLYSILIPLRMQLRSGIIR
jgi:hypothetical protein